MWTNIYRNKYRLRSSAKYRKIFESVKIHNQVLCLKTKLH